MANEAGAQKLRRLLAISTEMLGVADPEGRLVEINPIWEKAVGSGSGDLLGRPLLDLLHPADREAASGALHCAREAQDGGPTSFSARLVTKDGEVRHALWSVELDRETFCLYIAGRDNTRLKKVEAMLEREASLRDVVFEISPTYGVAISPDGKTLKMNRTMLSALGYTADEVLGKDYVSMFVPARDREALARIFADLPKMSGSTVNENWVVAKDGSERLIEWHGRFLRDKAGGLDYFFGIGVDITERRRVEGALRSSEQKLALHVRQTPLGAIEWNLNFEVVEWNPAAERIFGFSREEALGRHAAGLIVPESALAAVNEVWRGLIHAKGGRRSTNENITKSGAIIMCDWYNTPLVGHDGSVVGVASLVDDVTEQKRMEVELRDRERAQAEMIERLSAPILDLWEGILTMPVIGEVDERRAARMTESLLAAIVRARASVTVIDLTGIDRLDGRVADHLLSMIRGAGLLGCRCFVCGISPESAQVMAQAGRDFSGLLAFGTLRDALGHVLRSRRSDAGEASNSR